MDKEMKMASAPDPMDSLNDLAQMLFGKNLDASFAVSFKDRLSAQIYLCWAIRTDLS